MADNTLDDLILNDPEPEKGKSKSLLLLLGLIILLIIVGAILAKMIFTTSDSSNSETNITQEKSVQTTVDDNLASSNTTDVNSDIQEADKDLAPLDDMNDTLDLNSNATPVEPMAQGVVEDGVAAAAANKANSNTKSKENAEVAKKQKNKKTEVQEPKVSEQKPKKTTVKHTKAKPKVHHKKVYGGHGNVYIQVGSFVKGPESSFIEKIRRAGFRFRIKEINGKRRVYVGPFESRQEASRLLNLVRSKINPDAFIK